MNPQLQFHRHARTGARFYVLFGPAGNGDLPADQICFSFARDSRQRAIWEQLRSGDLTAIVIPRPFEGFQILATRLVGKGISCDMVTDEPFLSDWQVLGRALISDLPCSDLILGLSEEVPAEVLNCFWQKCTEVRVIHGLTRRTIFEASTISVRVASDRQDFEFIRRTADEHPFGFVQTQISLIAEEGGRRIGALLAEPRVEVSHAAEYQIFRPHQELVKQNSIAVRRVLVSTEASRRMRVQEHLFRAFLQIAPQIVGPTLSVVEGVSYDYNPSAVRAGFSVEVPVRTEGSFYYWKPFNLPIDCEADPLLSPAKLKAIHQILLEKNMKSYWMVVGRERNIPIAFDHNAWALAQNGRNSGPWRAITPGDVVFILNEDLRVRGFGTVRETMRREEPGLQQFPLWIDFEPGMVKDVNVRLSAKLLAEWSSYNPRDAIISISGDSASSLIELVTGHNRERGMWVRPNPYLLHQTDFQTIRSQVFVVQAWSLKDTIYPVIKEILEKVGYRVRHSQDRDGQLVFEDIWLMLNESEVVLVDFTHKRPNVYLEYGMALVLGKPIVAITQTLDDLPSDTPNLKSLLYTDTANSVLHVQLPKSVADTVEDIRKLGRTGAGTL